MNEDNHWEFPELPHAMGSLRDFLTDPRKTSAIYQKGDYLSYRGETGPVVGCNDKSVVLRIDGQNHIVDRDDPELDVAHYSEWKLNESLDSEFSWRWIEKREGLWTANFMVPWEEGDKHAFVYVGGLNWASIQFTVGASQGITGKGSASKILSTVMAIIRDYVGRNEHVDHVSFSAKKSQPSRVKLYRVLAQKLASSLLGFGPAEEDDSQSDDVSFTFKRV